MSEIALMVMFGFGWLIFIGGLNKRVLRKQNLEYEIENLEQDIDSDRILRFGTKEEARNKTELLGQKRKELLKHANWKEKFKFEVVCWSWHILGGLLLIIPIAIWIGEEHNFTWSEFGKNEFGKILGSIFVIVSGSWFLWTFYRLSQSVDKLDRQVVWLKHFLGVLSDRAVEMRKASISEDREIIDRLDKLEKNK